MIGAIVFAVALVGLVLALSSGGDPQPGSGEPSGLDRGTAGKDRATTTPAPAAQTPAPDPKTGGESAQTDEAAQESPNETPEALNRRGKALSDDGRYAEAVAPLRAAVDAYKKADQTDGLPYAFALFNLAVALNRSGQPAEAVTLLRQRLRFNNQTSTVQAELDRAIANLDAPPPQAKPPADKPQKPGKKDKDDD
ncbi:MAG: tetratricopeptide repeat protein [Solirubrobacteraceae bacterium]